MRATSGGPPVVIVGAGPVAMTAASLLARFDVPSVMLEAKPRRDPIGSKALCMQRDVLDVLERVSKGAGDDLVEAGVTWTLGRTYYREHELFTITFPEMGTAHFPLFVNVGQDRTEAVLEQAVADQPLTAIRYDHTVTGLSEDDDGITVTAASPEGEVELRADYVVAADGAHSPSRALLDIDFCGHSFDDLFLICDIRAQLDFEHERRFFFDPDWNPERQVLIHPQADSVWRIDWQVPPDFDLEEEQRSGALDARIRKIIGDRDYDIVWMTAYRFHQRIAGRFAVGRCFLAGDAAHLYAPFGARGLNSGIQDAENLAWKLGYVLNGWAPAGLLGTYDTERRAAAEENLAVTTKTMRFLVPQTEEEWAHRRAVLERAVDDPEAAAEVDSGKLAQPFCYDSSPLTTPADPDGGGDSPPTLLPGMLCPDLRCGLPGRPQVTRLRQLFGHDIVVLSAGAPDSGTPPRLVDPARIRARSTIRTTGTAEAPRAPQAPVVHHRLDILDPSGAAPAVLGLDDDQAAVVRPDGHVAAVVAAVPDAVTAAVRRVLTGR